MEPVPSRRPGPVPLVVIVDDEEDILQVVCDILELEGFQTLCLGHPREAFDLDDDTRPTLFVLDLMMPEMSGIELAHRLRQRIFPDIPIVAMSASATMRRAATDSHHFKAVLPKPFDLEELVGVVEQYA